MSIRSLIKRAPKRISAAVIMVAAAILIPAALHAWGPDRTLYTTAAPAGHVTFNSIKDNPVQGFEPNFMQVKEATASNTTYADSITIQDGKEYTVFVYYHNNASSTLNASGVGIAHGAYVRAEIPAIVNGDTASVAHVGATNATPTDVWDDVTFKSSSPLLLSIVPGSAHIYNKGSTNGMTLPDSIATTGAPLGYNNGLDGVVPGCNDYAGYVTFKVKAVKPAFTVQKQVRVAGTTEYSENVIAKAGDTLEYRIEYKNTGATKQNNVTVKDVLPAHVSYIAGSTTLKNAANPNGKSVSDNIVGAGLNIGDYTAGSNAFVKFNAKVGAIDTLECGTKTLTNKANVTVNGVTNSDTASATVSRVCDNDITVCELATNKIVTIKESQFDSSKYSKNLNDCKTITVCELATKKIVTIKESQFDSKKYSKNLKDCETPDKIVVCELATKQIVKIDVKDFDAKKYSKNLDDCKPPVKITVCEISTKKVVTIDESQYDATKYTKDASKCTPELPHTGPAENIVAFLGLGALIASVVYYIRSRRLA